MTDIDRLRELELLPEGWDMMSLVQQYRKLAAVALEQHEEVTRLTEFCQEFIWGEDNPAEYQAQGQQLAAANARADTWEVAAELLSGMVPFEDVASRPFRSPDERIRHRKMRAEDAFKAAQDIIARRTGGEK